MLSITVNWIDTSISSCSHKEADTRLLLHVVHAAHCGFTKATVRSVDTDVVVTAISLHLDQIDAWFCHSSMISQDVTRCLLSQDVARKVLGIPG